MNLIGAVVPDFVGPFLACMDKVWFFHESIVPRPKINTLKYFEIFFIFAKLLIK